MRFSNSITGGYVCVTSASQAFVIAGLVYMYIVLKTYKWEVESKKVNPKQIVSKWCPDYI
jgi:hypothetical protein